MKRLSSSDSSAAALITICQSTEEQSPRNKHMYGRELQSMLDGLDEEGCVVEEGHHSEKKRRLSVDQVKALEKSFEVENKLEPERKVKLAQELGLQPRQVAVWFQNRRARWKTKQLERDYGVLKANYEALKLNYDTLNQDNQALQKEIKELKSRLKEEKKSGSGSVWVKEEITVRRCSESEERNMDPAAASKSNKDECVEEGASASAFPAELKDKEGSSDSDSSAILNELDNSSPKGIQFSPPHSSVNCFQFHKPYHYVKMEEHNFLSAEEACNFFSDDQPPSLHWYSPDEWN